MTDLSQFRSYATFLMNSHQYENAIFYAELLINTNEENVSDFLILVEALYHNKQYRRALDFIESRKLEAKYLTFRLLAAQCCVAIKQFIKALDVLNLPGSCSNSMSKMSLNMTASSFFDASNGFWVYNNHEEVYFGRSYKELESNCCLLLGEIYEHMENRECAIDFYKQAAKSDVRNFNAVRKLYSGNMLTNDEARSFLGNLDYNDCGDSCWATVLRTTYENMFHIDNVSNHPEDINDHHVTVVEHPHIRRLSEATNYYNNSRFKKCYDITKSVLKEEPHNTDCFILHSAVLKELKLTNELFKFANSLVEMYPKRKETWYAMGCYYLATGRILQSRKQFLKATEIDKFFGYAWLAVGHTYSMENERDQALSAYCSASQAINESHIPILYIAVEYSLSKTMSVSLNYLEDAMNIGSFDPFCWHEKGFILYNNKNYQEALKCFLHAYGLRGEEHSSVISYWEPLLNNIGHCYFKLGELDKAITFLERALGKKPKNPSTLCSLALIYARKADFPTSKTFLNKVLGLNRDNHFASSLLQVITSLNYKYPRRPMESVSIEDLFKRPQSAVLRTSAAAAQGPSSSSSSTIIIDKGLLSSDNSQSMMATADNVCLDSEDEMDFS